MLPSVVIYLSGTVGVWAGEVLDGAVGTADGGAMGEHGPPRHTLSSSRELLHLAPAAHGRMLFCSHRTCEKGNFRKSVSAYQSLLSPGCFAALSAERSSRGAALSSQDLHVGRGVVLNQK